MRRQIRMALVALFAVVTVLATGLWAAGPKQYQWTGTVTEVDAKAKTIAVDKGGEVWEFSTEGLTTLKAKKGDKVTIYYITIAKKVDMK
jgi:hypothetical protein